MKSAGVGLQKEGVLTSTRWGAHPLSSRQSQEPGRGHLHWGHVQRQVGRVDANGHVQSEAELPREELQVASVARHAARRAFHFRGARFACDGLSTPTCEVESSRHLSNLTLHWIVWDGGDEGLVGNRRSIGNVRDSM